MLLRFSLSASSSSSSFSPWAIAGHNNNFQYLCVYAVWHSSSHMQHNIGRRILFLVFSFVVVVRPLIVPRYSYLPIRCSCRSEPRRGVIYYLATSRFALLDFIRLFSPTHSLTRAKARGGRKVIALKLIIAL